MTLRLSYVAPVVALVLGATACTSNPGGSSDAGATKVTVSSTADACDLSATTAPAGKVVFTVTNGGSEETEFYLYAADGKTVVGEVEDIGPGLSRDLTVDAAKGSYVATCKPGMKGDGIRSDFTVTD